jgi:hypothetical protein
MVIGAIDYDDFHRSVAQPARRRKPAETGTDDDDYRFATSAHRASE